MFIVPISPFIHLCRLNRPIGVFLLTIPCWWAVGLEFSARNLNFYLELLRYFVGALCLRSVGCIVNDWFDRRYDALIPRTRTRPLASGKLGFKQAFLLSVILMGGGFAVWLTLNLTARLIAIVAFILLIIYPLMKRFTNWPQAVLGIAFNSGILIACANNDPFSLKTISPWLLYATGVFWTIAYDTVYAFQDREQDQLLNLKSTAVLFSQRPLILPIICYGLMVALLLWLGMAQNFSYEYYLGVLLSFAEISYRLHKWNPNYQTACLSLFKHNAWLGFAIFTIIVFEKF